MANDNTNNDVQDNGTIPFDEPLENDEALELEGQQRVIVTRPSDPEIDSLYGKYKNGRLIVQPDFQRQFVWDQTKSSRLIESALLEIPLPVVYLVQDTEGKEQVIDGQQRLTAFFSFIDGYFPGGSDFRLRNLKIFTELNGMHFSELSEAFQAKIKYCNIRTITFMSQSDSELKFEVFERLNTGAVSLNDQELRNCIYRGPYNEIIKKLSENDIFRKLLDLQDADKRMKDIELVLRFASFYHATYLNYQPPMRRFLNADMEHNQYISPEKAQDLENAFKKAVSLIHSIFGKHAFKRFYCGTKESPDGRWEQKKFNSSLYDIMMWSFARVDKNSAMRNSDAIREAFIDIVANNEKFIDSIQRSTSSKQAVNVRFRAWEDSLQSILGQSANEPRCFSLEIKQHLFNANPTCQLCGNRIQDIDDAAVDHIEQYWRGGKTIPENARLAHRYCNSARPRND
jgi:hypothetical protein